VTVSFVDPGLLSLASFETHLLAYGQLFCAVPQLNFVYIGTRPTHFETARRLCLAMALCSMNPDRGVEGLRYFHYRHVWERKEYSKLNTDQIEFLNEATKRFTDAQTEFLYTATGVRAISPSTLSPKHFASSHRSAKYRSVPNL
jgi:hypothetical protein